MSELKDIGARREFSTGAVRDIADGKGRAAINIFRNHILRTDKSTLILEVSKQYEDGARKYSDRNWEKGIPVHCFIDSGVRHYLKFLRGDQDEPHDRAFVWNLLGAIWTHQHHPELIDLPFKEKTAQENR